ADHQIDFVLSDTEQCFHIPGRIDEAKQTNGDRTPLRDLHHPHLVIRVADAEAYLTEARTVANLDHPHIVPVFDVGSTELFPCFGVSKYTDGFDLASRLRQSRLPLQEAVELLADGQTPIGRGVLLGDGTAAASRACDCGHGRVSGARASAEVRGRDEDAHESP